MRVASQFGRPFIFRLTLSSPPTTPFLTPLPQAQVKTLCWCSLTGQGSGCSRTMHLKFESAKAGVVKAQLLIQQIWGRGKLCIPNKLPGNTLFPGRVCAPRRREGNLCTRQCRKARAGACLPGQLSRLA